MKRLAVSKTTNFNAYLKDKRKYIRIGMKLSPLNKQCLGLGNIVLRKLIKCFCCYKKLRIYFRFKIIKWNVSFITVPLLEWRCVILMFFRAKVPPRKKVVLSFVQKWRFVLMYRCIILTPTIEIAVAFM